MKKTLLVLGLVFSTFATAAEIDLECTSWVDDLASKENGFTKTKLVTVELGGKRAIVSETTRYGIDVRFYEVEKQLQIEIGLRTDGSYYTTSRTMAIEGNFLSFQNSTAASRFFGQCDIKKVRN